MLGEAPAPSRPARRISQTLLVLRQKNKPQMMQNSLSPFWIHVLQGSVRSHSCLDLPAGQFSPGLVSQA